MRILYSIIYVIAFTLDDFLVFFISMKTLEIKAISNKYSKYSSLLMLEGTLCFSGMGQDSDDSEFGSYYNY